MCSNPKSYSNPPHWERRLSSRLIRGIAEGCLQDRKRAHFTGRLQPHALLTAYSGRTLHLLRDVVRGSQRGSPNQFVWCCGYAPNEQSAPEVQPPGADTADTHLTVTALHCNPFGVHVLLYLLLEQADTVIGNDPKSAQKHSATLKSGAAGRHAGILTPEGDPFWARLRRP